MTGPPQRRRAGARAGDGRPDNAGSGATDDLADNGTPPDHAAAARAICLRLLNARPRTRFQLAAALRRRGVPPAVADAVLDRFTEVGLIDDPAFAVAWVESRRSAKGLARRALADELQQRGVEATTVESALSSVRPDEERARALVLAERRLAASRELPDPVRVRRVAAHLTRRGYPGGMAADVVRAVLAREGAVDDAVGGWSEDEAT